ncbi:MAG: DUF1631 family protein [Candidatus Accumulibacter sp. UW26]
MSELLAASRQIFQRGLAKIVRQCMPEQPAVLAAFEREIGEAHDQLALFNLESDAAQGCDLTASRLTLMGDDDLELDIRIRDIGNRLREIGGHGLWRSHQRYTTLLRRPEMSEASNPIGAASICLGLWTICRANDRGLAPRLILLDHIERCLHEQLPALYQEIDTFLAGCGVPADRGPEPPRVAARAEPGLTPVDRQPPVNPLATLQQALRQRREAEAPAALLPIADDSGAAGRNAALDTATMVMREHLFDRLQAIEARPVAAADSQTALVSPPRLPLSGLRARHLDLSSGSPEAIAMDTMVLIFEALFAADELPDAIKGALGGLQVPFVRLAIGDPSLFANDRHPARLLINRIGRAAIGLAAQVDASHATCRQICHLCATARSSLEAPAAALEACLAELDTLIDEREQRIRRAGKRLAELVATHENRQYASRLAGSWLRTSLARTRSAVVASFLEEHWLRVMIAAAADGGTQGSRWQRDSRTADDLIWSVLPKQSAEERKRLAGMAASLLGRIGTGLDEIGVSASERKRFFDVLFDLQTAALRGQAQSPDASPATLPAPPARARNPAAAMDSPDLLAFDGLPVHYLAESGDSRAPRLEAAAAWQPGDWLRFSASGQPARCGLCCWQSPSSTTVLLCNPDWGYAVAIARETLDQQLRTGRAQIASRIALFDAAAERALSRFNRS